MEKQISLLMVEDSESDAMLLVRELRLAGYEIRSTRVDTPQAFRAALDAQPWSMVLCDYSMPGFNGIAALRMFKERGLDIPFIFVSGTMSEDLAVEAMQAGAHDYVMKSNLKRLVPAVEREIREADERHEKKILLNERAEFEEELRRKDALFRSLVQHASDGIFLLDERGAVSYQSPSVAKILGYASPEDPPGDFFQLIQKEDRGAARDFLNRLLKSRGEALVREIRMHCANGSVRWVEAVGHNMFRDQNVSAIVINCRDITDRKVADEELLRSRQQLRALAANLQNAREEERRHLSREFHDQLGQSLTALRMGLTLIHNALVSKGNNADLESIDRELQTMRQEVDHATQSMRKTLSRLRPELLDQAGLLAALSWDAERFQRRTGITCTFKSDREEIALDPTVSIALFRIYQEAMTNILRHARATAVEVNARTDDNFITLSVRDNGIGIDPASESKAGSFGLVGMRERALLLNGSFDISSARGEGTSVLVHIPLKPLTD